MKFQLVLQFAAAEKSVFDELVALEEVLVEELPPTCEVDGHDFGSGEFNIFILTDKPKETFDAALTVVNKSAFWDELKAAYREQGKDDYVILWPAHLERFRVA